MRIRLPYRPYQDEHGGSFDLALCPVELGGVSAGSPVTRSFEALIDSGASRCTFDASFASQLRLDLRAGTREVTTGISGPQEVWIHPVLLFVGKLPIRIQAAFQEDLPIFGLLGMEGFFEHFVVTFDGLARECQLDRIYRA